ncbi:MAG: Gfo/Idh/MocA family protein, partial [bacterium]
MAVRIGVVGAGALGFHHTRILRDVKGAQLVGFHDANVERASKVSAELGVKAFPTLEGLLDAVEAVSVVVPTPAHHAVAAPALERGIHVLIEKPIATTLEEADSLLAIAKRTGAIVQTGHVERFNRAVRAALPYVDRPRFIESDRLAPFNPRGSDVAVVLDLMIHDIDLVRTFVGGHVSDVSAVGVPVLTPFVDIANARISFETGAVANITASRVSRERMRKLRIFQQSGYLSL